MLFGSCGRRLSSGILSSNAMRGSMSSSSSICDLPEDLVIEILSRLPVKSLLRFKCVCKSWYALVENPSFVSKQHNSSNNTLEGTRMFVHCCIFDKEEGPSDDDFLWLSNETLEVSKVSELSYLRADLRIENVRVLNSCYGVICLHDPLTNHLVLWNPSTRQSSKVVPKYCYSRYDENEFGFCYDVKTNDFKVVRFFKFREDDVEKRAEVYSLSTNSWRLVDAIVPHLMNDYFGWMFLNGVFSRLAVASKLDCETDENQLLISFDMRDEVFLLTPLPELRSRTTREDDYENRNITVLNESVSLIQILPGPCYEIWVLNEYGSNGSWTKLYTIGPFPGLEFPLGFWKNSKLFMGTENEEGPVVCDPITQKITQKIKKLQVDKHMRVSQLFSYKESLVSIKRGGNNLLKEKEDNF